MATKNKRPFYLSSDGSGKVSRTFKGFFTAGVLTAIAMIFQFFGIDIVAGDINVVVDSIADVIVSLGVFGGSIYGLYGAVMKVVNKVKK